MRLQDLARSTARRFRHPATWAALVGFGLLWTAVRLLAGQPFGRLGFGEFAVPTFLLAGHLLFSPAPWQWTGDARPEAPLWRGVLQALPWNFAWVLAAMLALHGYFPQDPPPRPPEQTSEQAFEPRPPRRQEPQEPGRRRLPRRDGEAMPLLMRTYPVKRQEFVLFLLNLPFALVLGWFLAGKERAESQGEAAEDRAREAQALALQAQLHPHALYNVLSGLTELVHEDPDAAEESLVELVALLRRLTDQGGAKRLPLAEERALVRHYLTIEAIRLGPRLRVSWDWPEAADTLLAPPLLLQPLVENAIAHGIAPHPEGGDLHIALCVQGTRLRLSVTNSGCPLPSLRREGTGLGNLRARLALMPHLAPTFLLEEVGGRTRAQLELTLPTAVVGA